MKPTNTALLLPLARGHNAATRWRQHERAEGVISMAIAVLIIAFLGVAMWIGFNQIWTDTEGQIADNMNQIGAP